MKRILRKITFRYLANIKCEEVELLMKATNEKEKKEAMKVIEAIDLLMKVYIFSEN